MAKSSPPARKSTQSGPVRQDARQGRASAEPRIRLAPGAQMLRQSAAAGGRAAGHRRGRRPLQGPHRRAVGGVCARHASGRRLHQVQNRLRAGGVVPRRSQGGNGARAGRQQRQRQRLHRQGGHGRRCAPSPNGRRGRRLPGVRSVSGFHRRDRRAAAGGKITKILGSWPRQARRTAGAPPPKRS